MTALTSVPDQWGAGSIDTATAVLAPALSTEHNLAPRDDIILIAGPTSCKIRISSDRLAEGSPVFNSMLNGQFAEGRVDRTATNPQTIELPEDDGVALATVCRLIYHKTSGYEDFPLPADELFRLVALAGKYACVENLRVQLLAVMQIHFDRLRRVVWKDAIYRASAAYLLGNAKFFETATSELIKNFNEAISGMPEAESGEVLPTSALLVMAEKRARAQQTIGVDLRPPAYCDDCGYPLRPEDYQAVLVATFDNVDAWPPEFINRNTVAEMVRQMKAAKVIVSGVCCWHGNETSEEGGRVDLLEVAQGVDQICKGLCLSCVRENSADLHRSSCEHRQA